jgi:hypothetical protein
MLFFRFVPKGKKIEEIQPNDFFSIWLTFCQVGSIFALSLSITFAVGNNWCSKEQQMLLALIEFAGPALLISFGR